MSTKLKMNQRLSMNKIIENPLKKINTIKEV